MRCSAQPQIRCSSISTKKSSTIWRIPELHCTRMIGKYTKNTVYWCNLKVVQKKGLQFYQTRSNAIILNNTVPAMYIEKVVVRKSGEELYNKMYQSPRLQQRAVLKPNLYHGRQDSSDFEARTSVDHRSKDCEEYGER